MRFLPIAFGGLLLTATLPALAQTTPAAAPPRFYVGLGAYSSYYQQYRSSGINATGFRLPVQLTVGYQLRPRLALQLGLAYSGYTSHYVYDGYYYPSPGPGGYYREEAFSTIRNVSASVLARYTLTRNLAHRVQFDALGGLTLVHRSGYYRGTTTDSLAGGGLESVPFSARGSQTALLLTAGLSTRYRLNSRFDLNLDYTLNRNLSQPDANGLGPLGVSGSAALGVRYRFGQR